MPVQQLPNVVVPALYRGRAVTGVPAYFGRVRGVARGRRREYCVDGVEQHIAVRVAPRW
jgi:hypothetical protein